MKIISICSVCFILYGCGLMSNSHSMQYQNIHFNMSETPDPMLLSGEIDGLLYLLNDNTEKVNVILLSVFGKQVFDVQLYNGNAHIESFDHNALSVMQVYDILMSANILMMGHTFYTLNDSLFVLQASKIENQCYNLYIKQTIDYQVCNDELKKQIRLSRNGFEYTLQLTQ